MRLLRRVYYLYNYAQDDLQDETISDDESVTGPVDKRQSVHSTKGKKIRKAGQHQFEEHTFKKPKFCYYCKGLIKGTKISARNCSQFCHMPLQDSKLRIRWIWLKMGLDCQSVASFISPVGDLDLLCYSRKWSYHVEVSFF